MIDPAVSAIIGVVIGFTLHEIARSFREHRKFQEERNAARILVNLEVKRNIRLLQLFWNDIAAYDEPQWYPKIHGSLPNWSWEVWNSQLKIAPKIFNRSELERLYVHYGDLERIRDCLLDLSITEPGGEMVLPNVADSAGAIKFQGTIRGGLHSWDECRFIIRRLLKNKRGVLSIQ